MRLLISLAYASAVFGFLTLAALFLMESPYRGAVFLWVAGIIVIAIYWLQTGKFFPTKTAGDGNPHPTTTKGN